MEYTYVVFTDKNDYLKGFQFNKAYLINENGIVDDKGQVWKSFLEEDGDSLIEKFIAFFGPNCKFYFQDSNESVAKDASNLDAALARWLIPRLEKLNEMKSETHLDHLEVQPLIEFFKEYSTKVFEADSGISQNQIDRAFGLLSRNFSRMWF